MTRGILAGLAAGFLLGTAGPSRASVLITIEQVGSDVVAKGSGSIDTTGATTVGPPAPEVAIMSPSGAIMIEGPAPGPTPDITDYLTLGGPIGFGAGLIDNPTSGSGDTFGMRFRTDLLLPAGYVSGASLSATDTYSNQTFASLGLTPGTYTWTLPNDTLMVQIGSPGSATPEPSSFVLFGVAITGLGVARWRRRKQGT